MTTPIALPVAKGTLAGERKSYSYKIEPWCIKSPLSRIIFVVFGLLVEQFSRARNE